MSASVQQWQINHDLALALLGADAQFNVVCAGKPRIRNAVLNMEDGLTSVVGRALLAD